MAPINLNKLIEDRKPVMELELDEKVYSIYPYEYLSTGVTARVAEVNANFEAINEEVQRALNLIDPQIADLNFSKASQPSDKVDPTIDAKLSRLYAARVAQEAKLLHPTRELIEALADMPVGTLADFPPTVLNQVFTEVNEKVFASLGKKVEEAKAAESPVVQPETPAAIQPEAQTLQPATQPAVIEPIAPVSTQTTTLPQ